LCRPDFALAIVDTTHLSLKVRPDVCQLTSAGTVSCRPTTSTATVQISAHRPLCATDG